MGRGSKNLIQSHEIIVLVIGCFVLLVMHWNEKNLKEFPFWPSFKRGYYFLLAAWFFTVIEGFFFNVLFNVLEHLCYVLAAFCWLLGTKRLVTLSDRQK